MPAHEFEKYIQAIRGVAIALADGMKEALASAREQEHKKKLAQREARHKEIAENSKFSAKAKVKEDQFALIYADPPWPFETYSEKGKDMTSPDNHYPTMSYEQIAPIEVDGYRVPQIVSKDAVCLMWCTSANFKRAMATLEAA